MDFPLFGTELAFKVNPTISGKEHVPICERILCGLSPRFAGGGDLQSVDRISARSRGRVWRLQAVYRKAL